MTRPASAAVATTPAQAAFGALFAAPAAAAPLFLAPMDGITDDLFRNLVVAGGGVDASCTDFLRISGGIAHGARAVRRRLGRKPAGCLTGVQFMAGEPGGLAASVAAAAAVGVDFIDLNFGCPAPRVVGRCAGSAMLASPKELGRVVAAAVDASALPVCAKIRVGVTDAQPLIPVLAAAAGAGARAICLHARRRVDSYRDPARWEWIGMAAAWLREHFPGVPLIGNGGVAGPADYRRLLDETGCAGVMIGCGALVDPFVFRRIRGGPPPAPDEAIAFVARYGELLAERFGRRRGLGRLKRVLRRFDAAGLVGTERRAQLLRQPDLPAVLAWLRESASRSGAGCR